MTLPASAILENIAHNMRSDASRDALTLGEFVELLGEKSLILGILIFTLPNIFSIPGVSSILSVCMSFLLLQLMLGRKSIWLPPIINKKSVPERALIIAIEKSIPWLRRIERICKPQLTVFTNQLFIVLSCCISLVLCAIIFLPLSVIGNVLPAICIIITMLGLLERDGRLILFGQIAGLVVIFSMSYIVLTSAKFLLAYVGIHV